MFTDESRIELGFLHLEVRIRGVPYDVARHETEDRIIDRAIPSDAENGTVSSGVIPWLQTLQKGRLGWAMRVVNPWSQSASKASQVSC